MSINRLRPDMNATLFDDIPADEPDPKTLRELLFATLLTALEDEAEREWPEYNEAEYRHDPDGTSREGSPYWRSWHTAQGIRRAAGQVKAALRTHEEYLVFDRANSRSTPPSDAELDCARHHDTCRICMAHALVVHRMGRDHRPVAASRETFVQGVHKLIGAIESNEELARIGETATLTLSDVRKALEQTARSAEQRWKKRETS